MFVNCLTDPAAIVAEWLNSYDCCVGSEITATVFVIPGFVDATMLRVYLVSNVLCFLIILYPREILTTGADVYQLPP